MSRLGLSLCALYLGIVGLCVWGSWGADVKGGFVLLQLPLAVQLALLETLDLGHIFHNASWISCYVLIGIPTLGFLYAVGWVVGKCAQWVVLRDDSPES